MQTDQPTLDSAATPDVGKTTSLWGRLVAYGREAQLPCYVLHQTPIIIIGYYVVQWNIPVLAKVAIISFASLAATLRVYESLIRRVHTLRLLFGGMKRRAQFYRLGPGSKVRCLWHASVREIVAVLLAPNTCHLCLALPQRSRDTDRSSAARSRVLRSSHIVGPHPLSGPVRSRPSVLRSVLPLAKNHALRYHVNHN